MRSGHVLVGGVVPGVACIRASAWSLRWGPLGSYTGGAQTLPQPDGLGKEQAEWSWGHLLALMLHQVLLWPQSQVTRVTVPSCWDAE